MTITEVKATEAQNRYYDALCEELWSHETEDLDMERKVSELTAVSDVTTKTGISAVIQGIILILRPFRRAMVDARTAIAKVQHSVELSALDSVGKVYTLKGAYYTIRANKQGTHAYAMVWDTERRKYAYASGLVNAVVNNGTQLNVEEVGALGLDTKHCMSCGKSLTNDLSRELGIGPVCRSRY